MPARIRAGVQHWYNGVAMSAGTPGPDANAQLRRVTAAWHACSGREIDHELRALGRSAGTFVVNSHQLLQAVEWFEDSLVHPLLQLDKRRELWAFAAEIVRLFQNAITAGQSFLEHSRTMVRRRYKGQPFELEFAEQYKKDIESSPVCMFVKELRGFVLHSKSMTPQFTRQLVDFSDPFESTHAIRLGTDALQRG